MSLCLFTAVKGLLFGFEKKTLSELCKEGPHLSHWMDQIPVILKSNARFSPRPPSGNNSVIPPPKWDCVRAMGVGVGWDFASTIGVAPCPRILPTDWTTWTRHRAIWFCPLFYLFYFFLGGGTFYVLHKTPKKPFSTEGLVFLHSLLLRFVFHVAQEQAATEISAWTFLQCFDEHSYIH